MPHYISVTALKHNSKGKSPQEAGPWVVYLVTHCEDKLAMEFSKPGFNSMWTMNFQMFKMDLEKAAEPEIKLPTSVGSLKKWESSRKTSTSALMTMLKPLTVWIITNCGKFWKRWEYQTTWPASSETCMEVKKQQLELDMEQQTGSKSGKEYVKAVSCHPAYLTYAEYIMWNAKLGEAQAGIKISGRNINNLRYADDITFMAESELKNLLIESERGEWKSWLKTQDWEN